MRRDLLQFTRLFALALYHKKLLRAKPPHTSDGAHAPRRAHGPHRSAQARPQKPHTQQLSITPTQPLSRSTPSLSTHSSPRPPRAHAADMIKEVKTTMHQVRAVLKLPCTKSTVVPKSQRVHCGPSLVPVHVTCTCACILLRLRYIEYFYNGFQNWLSIITGTGQALDMGAYTGADISVETRTSSYAKTHETPKG